MSYCIYVLKSKKNGKRYVGMTSKTIQERLKEHNSGCNKYTCENRPFEILYYEKDYCRICAGVRERFLKSGQGRRLLDFIDNSGISG